MKNRIHREFKPLAFLRSLSNKHIKELIYHSEVIDEDFWNHNNLDNLQKNDIYNYYNNLDSEMREEVEENFSLVNDLSSEKHMDYLLEACEIKKVDIDFRNKGPHELSAILFLNYREAFDYAFNWLNIDQYKSFTEYLGNKSKQPDKKGIGKFEEELIEYLHRNAKGYQIQLDMYDKENKTAYILSYEDYVKPTPEFENEKLVVKNKRPVIEMILIYYPKLAKLKINAQTDELKIRAKDLFAEHILKDKKFFDNPNYSKIYDLNRLKSIKKFELDPRDRIERVEITSLKVSPKNNSKFKIDYYSSHNLRDEIKSNGHNIDNSNILKAGIKFKFPGKGNTGSKTIYLSYPNKSTLADTYQDEVIAKYLVNWEIANV